MSTRLGDDRAQWIATFDRANFDGALRRCNGTQHLRQFVGDGKRHFSLGPQRFRRRNIGHRVLMLETALIDLKRSGKTENGFALLDRDDSTRGKTFPVAQSVDLIKNRAADVTRAQKIPVQRMDRTILGSRLRRRRKRLTKNLPAKNRSPTEILAMTTEEIAIEAFQCEKGDEIGEDSLHPARDISRIGWARHDALATRACVRVQIL